MDRYKVQITPMEDQKVDELIFDLIRQKTKRERLKKASIAEWNVFV